MKIGFVNLYSFRPHSEHLYFLSKLLQSAGHETEFMVCDSSVSNCYPRAIKGTSKWCECPRCMLGGMRTYPVEPIRHLSAKVTNHLSENILNKLTRSSACTLTRTELPEDCESVDVKSFQISFYRSVNIVFENTIRWIDEKNLDAIICFNGRMELLRAITYACEKKDIPYITHERTWFGDGLQLIPKANCLSLVALDRLSEKYKDIPLTTEQVRLAARHGAERFLQKNKLEWRLYNPEPEPAEWPTAKDEMKILILPSSKNEFEGHDEWISEWHDSIAALDELIQKLNLSTEQIVLRCHPNWSETIGRATGEHSRSAYLNWTKKRNIFCIDSNQRENTYDLIQAADLVVVNGSSTAIEAGICGKKIICLGHSAYQAAGFTIQIHNSDDWDKLSLLESMNSDTVIRRTLRYIYLRAKRFPQFVDYVRAIETTRFEYFEGADPERLIRMLQTGLIEADDTTEGSSLEEETPVVDALLNKRWDDLANWVEIKPNLQKLDIRRRFGFRWVDSLRARLPRGDR